MFRRCFTRRRSSAWTYFIIIGLCLIGGLYYFTRNKHISPQDSKPDEFVELRRKRYANRNPTWRSGPGEMGSAVFLSGDEKAKADELFKKEAFNIIASDKIALDRSLPDVRHPACKSVSYPKDLPKASVIIIFHNEAWSPLLRTAHSVVNRSPPEYLHEVILLDDKSYRPELGEKLEKYVAKTWPDGIVKIVRTKERSGLIRARLAGAKAASGEVIVFLDSHCEASEGWLQPLIARIHEKPSAILCPEIDLIDAHTLAYTPTGAGSVGGFWWSLHFSWRPIPLRERQRRKSEIEPIRLEPMLARIKDKPSAILCPGIDYIDAETLEYSKNGGIAVGGFSWSLHFTWRPFNATKGDIEAGFGQPWQPVRSPTMAGGLVAANRQYFFDIGGYDPGMDVWGGENLEISFRTWMCGGSLEFIPCSRVGHIFRASHPYTFPGNKDTHGINSMRLAEVWMDEYKRLFYMHRQDLLKKKKEEMGDISERVALRERLKCKSFKWYLENVYPEKFIIDENVKAHGMLRNPSKSLCLDTMGKDEKTIFNVGVFFCQGGKSANEVFSLSKINEIRREEACLDVSGNHDGAKVALHPCHGARGHQEWKHVQSEGTVIHAPTGKCLDVTAVNSGEDVVIKTCDGSDTQKWEFEHYLE